jgi:hypothetical protein
MTQFEKWCDENGYDPTGEFVYTGDDIEGIDLVNGDVLTLDRDDGTDFCTYKQSRVNRKLFSVVCPALSRLAQHKTESPQFDPHTFEDPNEQRKTELKSRAEELRAELARIEKELGE